MVNPKKQETKEKWDGLTTTYFKRLSTVKKLPFEQRESFFTEVPNSRGTRSNAIDKRPLSTRPIKGWKQLNNKQRHSLMDIDF